MGLWSTRLLSLLLLLAAAVAIAGGGEPSSAGDLSPDPTPNTLVSVDDLAVGHSLPGPLGIGDGEDEEDRANELGRLLPHLIKADAFSSIASLAPGVVEGGRALLHESSKEDTHLFSTEDGSIHLYNGETKKVQWSINSGGSLYSSYQNRDLLFGYNENASTVGGKVLMEPPPPEESHYVDFGNDGNLYVYTKIGKKRVGSSIERFISSTPHVSTEGIITLGSRRQTFFKVEPITGQIVSSSKSKDGNTTLMMPSGGSQIVHLYITRTDYELHGFYQDLNNTMWNMTFAKFDIFSLCPKDKLGLEYQSDVSMFPCGMKVHVHALQIESQPSMLKRALGLPKNAQFSDQLSLLQPKISCLPYEDSMRIDETTNLCEIGKSCLMKIDEVVAQPAFATYKVVGWSMILIILLSLLLAFLLLHFKRRRILKADGKVKNNSGKKHRVAVKKKKSQKTLSSENPSMMNMNKDDVGNVGVYVHSNLQNHDLDSAQVKDSEFGDGHWVGELFVSNREIAKGSNGTVVYEGIQDRHRKVAVKRLLLSHNEVAIKEIDNLILSDHHPNIVRFYKREQDSNFVYISLERCSCSLNDMIQILGEDSSNFYLSTANIYVESLKGMTKDDFWRANGCPSSLLLNLMRDIVRGLAHLHQLGIVHRDLKPQNVLISQENTLCAKISDMGISKLLPSDMTSCHDPTGYGSSGWLAPEQIQHGRQTRAVDLFTLGCVLFFCVTGGKHPFGDRFERDINITKNNVDLFLVEHLPEAMDLFSRLLNPNSELRPKANEVYHHPFFWDVGTRLSFLRDASDIIESEDKEGDSDILKAIEEIAPTALGCKWDEKLEVAFIENIGRYRRYKYESVRDLLRVIRNKLNHYRDLPEEIQTLLGSVPSGFYRYFASRFPKVLIEVYKVMYKFCVGDEEDHRLVFKFNKKKEREFIKKYFTWVV